MSIHEGEPRGRKEKVISLGEWFPPFGEYQGAFDPNVGFAGTEFRIREANGLYYPSLNPDSEIDKFEHQKNGAYILTPLGLTRHDTINDATIKEVEDRFESKLLEVFFNIDGAKEPVRGGMNRLLVAITTPHEELPYELQLRSPFADFSHKISVDGLGSEGMGTDWTNGKSESGMIFVPQISVQLIRSLEVRVTPPL